ncbi:uncharacterized protein LOC118750364 [Rhagoletis pomonella]|uniref:uncharacterized protein LOC118750364 n=1 Tax=Rhagoletis pomonella TaxID=28610 RepID=UPI00177F9FBC|nr:uncharacterized protein LOC118750364 [Rhagoletis pomonella]
MTNSTALDPASSPFNQTTDRNTHDKHEIRLPHIQIPEFDGTYTEWIRFRDLFEAMIHTRASLSDVERFEHLQTRLKGDALSLVKHLRPTNENYKIAWDLLSKKYNKNDKVKRAYLELIFDQPAMKCLSPSELKIVVNTLNEGINALKAVDEPVEHWDSVLLFHIEKKIDSETLILLYREKKSDQVATFAQFLNFLEERLFELESVKRKTGNLIKSGIKAAESKPNANKCRNQSSAYTSVIQTCPVCAKNHALFHCNQFKMLDIERRINIVRNNNRCFNRLQDNHRAAQCTRSNCRILNEKHNSFLHRVTTNPIKAQSQEAQQRHSSISVNATHQYNQTLALLPAATVLILDGQKSFQPCRVLLDSGAQVTLISEA